MPRHEDELELEVDDPLLVEVQAEDYWYEAYNMRTGDRGIFPAYYAIEVTKDPDHMTGSESLYNIFALTWVIVPISVQWYPSLLTNLSSGLSMSALVSCDKIAS